MGIDLLLNRAWCIFLAARVLSFTVLGVRKEGQGTYKSDFHP